MKDIESVFIEALKELEEISNSKFLEEFYIKYLGRKGIITFFLKNISSLPKEERPPMGKRINEIKLIIKQKINKVAKRIDAECDNEIESDYIDVSIPGRKISVGKIHPITQILNKTNEIFTGMGFQSIEGPEVETEYYNFEALNLPKNHPAREMQDTFYISKDLLLRTHTSSTQPRIMEKQLPPIRVISFGKVYRCDYDTTHTPMFHQVEGLCVDTDVTFAQLKGLISVFIEEMFGSSTKMRFRPSYFPFTEPSAEVDIACVICGGTGCNICSKTGWLEVIGSGMVHPAVFEKVRYKKDRYKGFAFGIGIERIAMIKYHIDDIRRFFDNDFRFLRQF